MGETYESLSISEDKNKTAQATLKLLVDPTFIFWATHMRLIYTLVYKSAFSAVQANHHHAAPELAGPDGLPVRWAATFRSAVIKPARGSGKVSLSETVCAPLVALLRRSEGENFVGACGPEPCCSCRKIKVQQRKPAFTTWPHAILL